MMNSGFWKFSGFFLREKKKGDENWGLGIISLSLIRCQSTIRDLEER